MIRGLYIAGTGMLVERSRMDTIANNIVNVETQGFKQDTVITKSFREMLINRLNDASLSGGSVEVGPLSPGVYVDEMITSFKQGSPEPTELNTDLCVIGPAYFVVEMQDGEVQYTRAGNFSIDMEGNLLDAYGNFVLDDSDGHIQVESDNFKVTETGEIIENGETVATLKLVEFEDQTKLRKVGNNYYIEGEGSNPQEAEASTVLQRYLEGSNVNIAQEMVNMIITNRAYESNQRAARMIDETLQKTVNEIAKF